MNEYLDILWVQRIMLKIIWHILQDVYGYISDTTSDQSASLGVSREFLENVVLPLFLPSDLQTLFYLS